MILENGIKAPQFTQLNQSGNDISLSDYEGKKVVLYFYPKDNTPGCTIQANDFTKLNDEFSNSNAVVLGVSKDSIKSHEKFCNKFSLTIDLISDEDTRIIESYGVWQEKKLYGRVYMGIVRSTYLIDEKGFIENSWTKVKSKGHAEEVLEFIKNR